MKDLIISLAVDGREKYSERIVGLEKSLVNWTGDVRIYTEFPDWCTPHQVTPYAFKYDFIKRAVNDGYRRVFWLDSIMRLIQGKNISTLLDESATGMVAFHNLGHDLEKYINNTAIKNMYIEHLAGIMQTWGGALFFDFNRPIPTLLFEHIEEQILLGSFNDDDTERENFIAHRHDQAVISWLLHKFKVPLLPYGIIAAKKDLTDKTFVQYGD